MSAGPSGGGDSSGGPSTGGPSGSAGPDEGPAPAANPAATGSRAPRNAALAARAAELGTTEYDPAALIGEFRRSAVLVPVTADGGWWAAESGGIRWLHAFTGEAALARFAQRRDASAGREWPYVTVYGARLLDVAVPAAPVPTGVVLDVAGPAPAFLPPMAGIVPDAAALDLAGEDGRG
ncbi:hypothetical protein GCM10010495_57710 [Kitasatospora herbaricolor]|uniref:SseB family protein n=1 Tax=Kitasatospora herbaricolor TaxID=68217 RepID=UPI00174C39BC|nr:SseB family protein [Kitasatospora herbaricolor]MDQ0310785.1 hypothetical protein [Kitasatospora herbaricolor]GGV33339.1 hypothetical protein GCM10010495_57710 [Kitasatospora herbaricolor]